MIQHLVNVWTYVNKHALKLFKCNGWNYFHSGHGMHVKIFSPKNYYSHYALLRALNVMCEVCTHADYISHTNNQHNEPLLRLKWSWHFSIPFFLLISTTEIFYRNFQRILKWQFKLRKVKCILSKEAVHCTQIPEFFVLNYRFCLCLSVCNVVHRIDTILYALNEYHLNAARWNI